MKTYPVATILWAIIKSLDITIKLIEAEKYDFAIERCKTTKAAIRNCMGCESEEDEKLIDSI
jgi:hypothetical protein